MSFQIDSSFTFPALEDSLILEAAAKEGQQITTKGYYDPILDGIILLTPGDNIVKYHETVHRLFTFRNAGYESLRKLVGVSHTLIFALIHALDENNRQRGELIVLVGERLNELQAMQLSVGSPPPDSAEISGKPPIEIINDIIGRLRNVEELISIVHASLIPASEIAAIDFLPTASDNIINMRWTPRRILNTKKNWEYKNRLIEGTGKAYSRNPVINEFYSQYGGFENALKIMWQAYNSINHIWSPKLNKAIRVTDEIHYELLLLNLNSIIQRPPGKPNALMFPNPVDLLLQQLSLARIAVEHIMSGQLDPNYSFVPLIQNSVKARKAITQIVNDVAEKLLEGIPYGSVVGTFASIPAKLLRKLEMHLEPSNPEFNVWFNLIPGKKEPKLSKYSVIGRNEDGSTLIMYNIKDAVTYSTESYPSYSLFNYWVDSENQPQTMVNLYWQPWVYDELPKGFEQTWWRWLALFEGIRKTLKHGQKLSCPFKDWKSVGCDDDCPIREAIMLLDILSIGELSDKNDSCPSRAAQPSSIKTQPDEADTFQRLGILKKLTIGGIVKKWVKLNVEQVAAELQRLPNDQIPEQIKISGLKLAPDQLSPLIPVLLERGLSVENRFIDAPYSHEDLWLFIQEELKNQDFDVTNTFFVDDKDVLLDPIGNL